MTNYLLKLPAMILFLFLAPASTQAQEQPFQMRLNVTLDIDGSQAAAFDKSWRVIADRAMKDSFPFYTVVSESGNRRLILFIIKSYADLATIAEHIDKYRNSDDADLRAAVTKLQQISGSYNSYVSRIAGELTYSPPESYRSGFVRYSHYTMESENKAAVKKLVMDYRDRMEQAGVSSALHARWLSVGSEGTVLELLKAANSAEEMRDFDEEIAVKIDARHSAEFESQLQRLTTSVSHRYWKPRADLSISINR